MTIRINFSGHPVDGFSEAPLVGVNLDMTTGEALVSQLSAVLDNLSCAGELERGAGAEIILPGMSTATGVFLALWHGRYGSFPNIRWSVRGQAGFEWPDAARADLQAVRLQARTSR